MMILVPESPISDYPLQRRLLQSYLAAVTLVFILNSSIDLTTSQALVGEFTNSFYP